MNQFLRAALKAAKAAAEDIMCFYRGDFEIELKPDQTPVTMADRRAEEIISGILLDAFPDHGFYGEESGKKQADADYLWLVDPIDGTKSFVGGYGMFSTQIALMHRGELVLGVSSAPAHGELAWATRGSGSRVGWFAGCMSAIFPPWRMPRSPLATCNPWPAPASGQTWAESLREVNRIRGYGDYYHYHRLAAGQLDAVIESDVNILDIAALYVIVTEAGGTVHRPARPTGRPGYHFGAGRHTGAASTVAGNAECLTRMRKSLVHHAARK